MIASQALALLAGLAIPTPASPATASTNAECQQLAAAQPSATGGWNGAFRLNRSQSDDLEKVADDAVSQLGRRARRRAGGTLRERLTPEECLRVSEDSAGVTIEAERGVLWQVGRDGKATTGSARSGGARTLPATLSDSLITITGSGERGQGQYQLRRGSDGARLELAVAISARRLDHPIAYTLVYDAVNQPQP